MYVLLYMVVQSTGVSLNAGDMTSGKLLRTSLNAGDMTLGKLLKTSLNAGGMATGENLFKTLVSKEKRRYKEGDYDLDLTCISPRSIVLVLLFVCCAIVGNLLGPVDGALHRMYGPLSDY